MPNDSDFQTRVLLAAFDLLDAKEGPVLTDYDEDVPQSAQESGDEMVEGLVCPIDLPRPPSDDAETTEIEALLTSEIATLMPWYDLAVRTRGRTTVGQSELPVEEAARYVTAFHDDQSVESPIPGKPANWALKLACEDLKAFYSEAITAQPGFESSERVENWLFKETVLGRILWSLREICRSSEDEYCQYLSRNSIVPDRMHGPSDGPPGHVQATSSP